MFGLGLSRYIPAPIRPQAVAALGAIYRRIDDAVGARSLRLRLKAEPNPYRGERIALVGFMHAPTGLGRGARLMHRAFDQKGATISAFDLAAILAPSRATRRAEIERIAAFAPTDVIAHVNPPLMRRLIRRLPADLVASVGMIGYWAWELNRLPPDWAKDAAHCDGIWAPSDFVAAAVRDSLPGYRGAVRVEPHAVEIDPLPLPSEQQRRLARERLGISPEAFVAGFGFSMASNFARKNPLAVVAAFQRAFSDRKGAKVLLLRCPDADAYPPGRAALQAAAAKDDRIRLLLDRHTAPLETFYACLDVYISLHRSEGFGLQLSEALQTGAEVVATGWGMSPVIAAHPNLHAVRSRLVPVADKQGVYASIAHAEWAEPDIDEAALFLTQIATRHAH